MLIRKNLTITINGNIATLNEPIYLFQNDKNIDLAFKIVDAKFIFNDYSGNILVESTAKYATIKVLKPNGSKFTSDKLAISDNQVILSITHDFTDQIEEIGVHTMQIQLYDAEDGRVTIPAVTFTVLEPIFEDENEE